MSEAEIEIDREYVVPLTRAWITARHQRSSRAVRLLREFAVKHMKSEDVKIDTDLSERIWERGITKPPRKIRVRMTKDEDGLVRVSLPKEEEKKEEQVPEAIKAEEGSQTAETEDATDAESGKNTGKS